MDILITAALSGFFGAAFTLIGTILYNRSKRPAPNYDFELEKEITYYDTTRDKLGIIMPTTGHFLNYIRIENYGVDPLFNVSTKIWFDTKKERRYYQTMEIAENLFDLEIECLSEYSHIPNISLAQGRKEIWEEKTKQGFFVPDKAMERLKRLSPIKVKVEYEWDDISYSDIWMFDFSDENEIRFYFRKLTFWQKTKLFLKRIFL